MNVHPDALVFPPMTAGDYERLRRDIAEHGLLEPIVLLNEQILDGRHRQQVCDELGIKPRYRPWDATCGVSPLEWVIAKNLSRRHLTKDQAAALAVEFKPRLAETAKERMAEGGRKGSPNKGGAKTRHLSQRERGLRSDVIAGKTFGVGERMVSTLDQVRRTDERLFEQVKAGQLTVEGARRKANLPAPRGKTHRKTTKLKDAIRPLDQYLKDWTPERLSGTTPGDARRLLKIVQRVDQGLLELERALEERTIVSRALR